MSIELWTDERDEALRKMRAARVTFHKIGEVLNIDPETASRRARKLGIISLPAARVAEWTPDRDRQLRALWATRPIMSAKCIGATMGITKNSAIGRAHRLNLPKRPKSGGRAPNKPRPDNSGEILETPQPSDRTNVTLFRPKLLAPRQGREPWPIPQAAIPAIPEPYGPPVPLHMLRKHHCREVDGNAHYCGAPKVRGSFCAHHAAINYVEASRAPRRRAA